MGCTARPAPSARGATWRPCSTRSWPARRARQLCAGLCAGEIVLFDKAYYEPAHFWELARRSTPFVTRVELDGKEEILAFLTSHPEWAGGSVADLYR